ncbi:MAG: hypothetical protein COA45_05835 [Zetaproteobacteria bacterium]|nr:MAG: hypothetical protein COA45_05835 [Zetaproteobacteria bacterium]
MSVLKSVKFFRYFTVIACLFTIFVTVTGCARIELMSHVGKKIVGTTAKSKGRYKVGSPYTIKGRRYYPAVNYSYNKTGVASWYGPNFHGKQTANGEIFYQNELTAAHKTLPLPSIVRVTNLENGRSLIVRVNDRGPYAHNRIIDMSKRSSELLGFRKQGVAKVRVQVLEAESRMVAEAARNGQDTRGMEVPMNKAGYKAPAIVEQRPPHPPQAVEREVLAAKPYVPGHVKDGVFYPDPMIAEYPIKGHRIFVQMGSFTSRESAMKYASSLEKYGRAQVHTITIDGAKYYRVRLPNQSIPAADALLEKVSADGHQSALIVVD